MELKALTCTRCGANISERSLEEPVINCEYCGCTFVISGNVHTDNRSLVPVPESMTILNTNGIFTISYKWKSAMGIVLIIFGLFFLLFSTFWTTMAFAGAGFFGIFGLFFVFLSFFLIYMGIAYSVNRTIITIRDAKMEIRYSPLFWPGATTIGVGDIVQLYVQRKEYQNKGNTTYMYNLIALQKGNRSIKLLKMIQEPEIAKCVEQQLERYLGIKDISIPGEYKI